MIIVTGLPRSGTSMMMYCLHKAGVELAFEQISEDKRVKEQWGNIYGFYEGKWNGKDGLLKDFSVKSWEKRGIANLNPRTVFMERDINGIVSSWDAMGAYVAKDKRLEFKAMRLQHLKENNYPFIIVDYDIFVNNPETYRKDFNKLFPELNYDTIINGIDKKIYTDRRQ